MLYLIIFAIASAVSFGLTVLMRRYAVRRAILDHPNHRSLHERPVARGGGLAIAATTMAGIGLLALTHVITAQTAIALIGGGLPIALVGWLDDVRGGIPPLARAAVHFLAAIWALVWLNGLPELIVGTGTIALGAAGSLLAVLGIVWWINLYNFMDGIDGIAAGQAFSVAGIATLLLLLRADAATAAIAVLVAASAAGFLVMNWSPARIFMGDAGSGFLGYTFAVLALTSERVHSVPLVVWLVLSGVFIFDSTVTLIRRVARGERFYSAHRSHAYQRLVASGLDHKTVTSIVLLFNLVLGMLALAAVLFAAALPYAATVALTTLTAAYLAVERKQPMRRSGRATQSLGITPGSLHD